MDNEKYVERGRMLIMQDDSKEWAKDLKRVNRRKNGAPFRYANAMFASVAIIRSMLQLPYRQLAGMMSEMLQECGTPSYPTLYRRLRDIKISIHDGMIAATFPNGGARQTLYAVDATGMKAGKRGTWIHKKWKLRHGFVKMHVCGRRYGHDPCTKDHRRVGGRLEDVRVTAG